MNKTVFTTTTLGKLAKFTSGAFLAMEDYNWGKIPVYGGNGISGYHDKKLIMTDTIIFGRVGAHCGSVHISNGSSWITDNAIFIKELSNQINLEYLFRFLSRLNIRLLAEVSAQPKIDQDILKHITVKFPSLKEQQKIASILSGVDAIIEATQKTIEKTERLKKGLMQQLLTKGIGHTKFKKIKWLFGNIVSIPYDWKVTKFRSKIKMEYGFSLREDKRDAIGKPVYGSGGVIGSHSKPAMQGPGVIVSRKGSLGNTFYEPGPFFPIDTVYFITKKETLLDLKFLFYYIRNMKLENYAIVTSKPGISRSEIYSLPIMIPSHREQQKIASILSGVDAYIQKNQEYKEKLEELKKGLMQNLLTGKIRVKI